MATVTSGVGTCFIHRQSPSNRALSRKVDVFDCNAIETRLSDEQLRDLDNTFATLGTADGGAFKQMTQIGDYLRDESRAVVNSMFARQEEVARERVATTWRLLEPLEKELSDAMKQMQRLEASLGNATSL